MSLGALQKSVHFLSVYRADPISPIAANLIEPVYRLQWYRQSCGQFPEQHFALGIFSQCNRQNNIINHSTSRITEKADEIRPINMTAFLRSHFMPCFMNAPVISSAQRIFSGNLPNTVLHHVSLSLSHGYILFTIPHIG